MKPTLPPRNAARRAITLLVLVLALISQSSALAAFGLTESGGFYIVDTGAGLVFKVNRGSGGIRSIVWNGTELNDPNPKKESGIASGLGGSTVTAKANLKTIVITVSTDSANGVVANLTHYYVVQEGVNNIYMATYATKEPNVGELRWITRLQTGPFPNAPIDSDNRGTTGAIESKDVFGNSATGITRSKYYGNQRAMDLSIRGITGPGRGVFMAYGNREGSSGGPFYRDIQNQSTEVYNYMNSGHGNPDVRRLPMLYGPYALCFTNGTTPAVPEMSFMSGLGLTGSVPAAGRGSVTCSSVTGRDAHYAYTIGFSNSTAQYWTVANAANGAFTMAGLLPGTYTMQVYKNELSVYTDASVTVAAGKATAHNPIAITSDPSAVVPLWRIGDWDGTPLEFLNGDKITSMHPSDKRMASWDPGTYIVGTSTPAKGMQACQWKAVPGNNNKTIQFTLTDAQVKASTIRIGITTAAGGARPNLKVNSWNAPAQHPSTQPSSRTLTVGTYRGNNTTFTFSVPASALLAGTNTMSFSPLSGSNGPGFLSPGYSLDCIEFSQGTPQAPAPR
jgi:rhamnogalacturonan endolyase